VDFNPLAQATDASRFDVNNAAGFHLNGITGMARGNHAFIQADWRFELRLEFAMIPDIVFEERLLDQE
jgi:hypothetical protein